MKGYRYVGSVLFLVLSLLCFSVQGREIPSSKRSRTAVARVKPRLVENLTSKGLKFGSPIFIRIFKESSELEVWVQKEDSFALFHNYPISNHNSDLGPKLKHGDGRSPEGFYFVTPNRLNPWSSFHLSFNIGYPNSFDRINGRTGRALMVHGGIDSEGCFAMKDYKIEEIYAMADAALRNGQKFFRVQIFPFRMTQKNMDDHRSSQWFDFWRNLKQGYDLFEKDRIPPDVQLKNMRYVFFNKDRLERQKKLSEAVKKVQRSLKKSGYYALRVDGNFGRGTKMALQRYLQKRGYYAGIVDGQFGEESQEALKKCLKASAASPCLMSSATATLIGKNMLDDGIAERPSAY